MEKKRFLILFLFTISVHSQNLVLNPSFEEFFDCPKGISFFHRNVKNWSIPNNGTTDYFNSCSSIVGFNNFIGEQQPYSGNGYCGIYVYQKGNYREYIQGKLKVVLERNKTYEISFNVSLAEKSSHSIDAFQLLFLQNNLTTYSIENIDLDDLTENSILMKVVNFKTNDFIKDTSNWVKLTASYKASGFETHFIIGNFNKNSKQNRLKVNSLKGIPSSYYYIDDVSITPFGSEELKQIDIEDILIDNNLKVDTTYTFKNVLFDFDTSELLDISRTELNKLSNYLMDNQKLHIEIYGHTDDIGTLERNEELSLERAKAVSEYLISQGINLTRIKWFGLGSSKPIFTNETEEGRSNNRRVEFKLISMKN